jgi:hypothetical protein
VVVAIISLRTLPTEEHSPKESSAKEFSSSEYLLKEDSTTMIIEKNNSFQSIKVRFRVRVRVKSCLDF